MSDEQQADPQAQADTAAENAISDFRTTHKDALLSTGHVEHERRTNELRGLYEKRFAATPNQFDPVMGQERPDNKIDEVADEAMAPLSADELIDVIGPDSDFGMNVDTATYGWDGQLESNARQAFAAASLNGAQARTAATSYYESIQNNFDPGGAARQSTELLQREYGDLNVAKALAGTNKMLRALGGTEMCRVIASSGLGNHPRFVGEAVRVARERGYWT